MTHASRILGLFLLLSLIGCTQFERRGGQRLLVSLGFGGEGGEAVRLLTPNELQAASLLYETISDCGGVPKVVLAPRSPATDVAVCASDLGTYPRLLKVDVTITGEGQGTRTYSLDLTKPEQLPAELKLERVVGNGTVVYRITDKGGEIVSHVELVRQLLAGGLAVEYVDQHFIEGLTYESVSEFRLKASYGECPSCVTDLGQSVIPEGISVVANQAGFVILDTEHATTGTHTVALAVKRNRQSADVTMVYVLLSIVRRGAPEEKSFTLDVDLPTNFGNGETGRIFTAALQVPRSSDPLAAVTVTSELESATDIKVSACGYDFLGWEGTDEIKVRQGDNVIATSPTAAKKGRPFISGCVYQALDRLETALSETAEVDDVAPFEGEGDAVLSVDLTARLRYVEGLRRPNATLDHLGRVTGKVTVTYSY